MLGGFLLRPAHGDKWLSLSLNSVINDMDSCMRLTFPAALLKITMRKIDFPGIK
jgi:hypothetical protein